MSSSTDSILFLIGHDWQPVLDFNVTRNPSSPLDLPTVAGSVLFAAYHEYLPFDRDPNFGHEAMEAVKALGAHDGNLVPKPAAEGSRFTLAPFQLHSFLLSSVFKLLVWDLRTAELLRRYSILQ